MRSNVAISRGPSSAGVAWIVDGRRARATPRPREPTFPTVMVDPRRFGVSRRRGHADGGSRTSASTLARAATRSRSGSSRPRPARASTRSRAGRASRAQPDHRRGDRIDPRKGRLRVETDGAGRDARGHRARAGRRGRVPGAPIAAWRRDRSPRRHRSRVSARAGRDHAAARPRRAPDAARRRRKAAARGHDVHRPRQRAHREVRTMSGSRRREGGTMIGPRGSSSRCALVCAPLAAGRSLTTRPRERLPADWAERDFEGRWYAYAQAMDARPILARRTGSRRSRDAREYAILEWIAITEAGFARGRGPREDGRPELDPCAAWSAQQRDEAPAARQPRPRPRDAAPDRGDRRRTATRGSQLHGLALIKPAAKPPTSEETARATIYLPPLSDEVVLAGSRRRRRSSTSASRTRAVDGRVLRSSGAALARRVRLRDASCHVEPWLVAGRPPHRAPRSCRSTRGAPRVLDDRPLGDSRRRRDRGRAQREGGIPGARGRRARAVVRVRLPAPRGPRCTASRTIPLTPASRRP